MKFLLIGLLWLAVAIAVGLSGLLSYVRPTGPQVMIFGLTSALIAAYWLSSRFGMG